MNAIIYNEFGKILRSVSAPIEYLIAQKQEGEFILFGTANDATQYIDPETAEIRDIPTKPNDYSEFNWQTKQWGALTDWLDKAKADAVKQINQLAGQKITAVYPLTKQNYLQGRYIELMMLGETDSDEAKAIAVAWQFLKAVKEASDAANVRVNQADTLEAITAIVDEFQLFNL